MIFHGYEGYNIKWLNNSFFSSSSHNYNSKLCESSPWMVPDTAYIRMHDGSDTNEWLESYNRDKSFYELPDIAKRLYTPKQGDTLYFDKSCTIPRIKCEGTWNRTIKMVKADVVVTPNVSRLESIQNCAVFVDDVNKTIAIIRRVDSPIPTQGQTFDSWFQLRKHKVNAVSLNNDLNKAVLAELSNTELTYIGTLFICKPKDRFVFDIIDGIYPRIICEQDLLHLLSKDEEKFTADFTESLIDMLNSKDGESVHQGMRILASMDYTHYPSIAKYILSTTETNWARFKPFNSAVRFMLNSLGSSRSPFSAVTVEEFSIAHDIFKKIIEHSLTGFIDSLQRETNMVLGIPFDVSITHKDINTEALSDEISSEEFEDEQIDEIMND